MFYTIVISILSQTLQLRQLGTINEAFQDLYGHGCSFMLAVLQKDKERFFISSEPFIFLPREGLIQLPAWCHLGCSVVSKTGSRQEARTRTCILEEQLQAKWDTHQVTLTNELTSWIVPATSTLQCRNKVCFCSGSRFVLKKSLIGSSLLCCA